MLTVLGSIGFAMLLSLSATAADEASVVTDYQKAIAADPQDVQARFNLGLALYKMEQYDESQKVLEQCLRINTEDKAAHAQLDGTMYQILGLIYLNHRRDDSRAIDALRRSLDYFPEDAEIHYALGLAHMRRGDSTKALEAFQRAIQLGLQDTELYFYLGRAQVEKHLDQAAVVSYQKALELKPDFKAALEDLALLYRRLQDDDHAIEVLQKLIQLDPMHFNANSMLGFLYHRKKMYPEMVAAYNRAVAVKPDLADAHYNLGTAYYYQTRYDLAMEALKKAAALNPKDGDIFNLLGQVKQVAMDSYMQRGISFLTQDLLNDAAKEFRQVLAIDSSHHKAKAYLEDTEYKIREQLTGHLRLGEKYYKEGRLEAAYNEYEQALKLDPDSEPARNGVQRTRVKISGLLEQRMKQGAKAEKAKEFKEAIRQYELALALKPGYDPARKALKKMEEALQQRMVTLHSSAQQALKSNAYNAAIHGFENILKLAEYFKDAAWEEKALNGLTQANAQKAEAIESYLDQGKQAMRSNQLNDAKQAFERVLDMEPHNKTANEFIMKLTGSKSEAKATAERIKSTYYRGVDYYVKGEVEKAIVEWEKVVELDPENQDARINIERAKAKLEAIRKLTGEE